MVWPLVSYSKILSLSVKEDVQILCESFSIYRFPSSHTLNIYSKIANSCTTTKTMILYNKPSDYPWLSTDMKKSFTTCYTITALIRERSKIWHAFSGNFVHPGQKQGCMNCICMHDKSSWWLRLIEYMSICVNCSELSPMVLESLYSTRQSSSTYAIALMRWPATWSEIQLLSLRKSFKIQKILGVFQDTIPRWKKEGGERGYQVTETLLVFWLWRWGTM